MHFRNCISRDQLILLYYHKLCDDQNKKNCISFSTSISIQLQTVLIFVKQIILFRIGTPRQIHIGFWQIKIKIEKNKKNKIFFNNKNYEPILLFSNESFLIIWFKNIVLELELTLLKSIAIELLFVFEVKEDITLFT